MSIDKATTPISEYIGDGTANTFGMVFPAGSSSELLIYLRYVGTDAVIAYDLPGNDTELYPMQPLAEGVDYTLSNLNIPSVYGSLSLIDAGQLWTNLGKLDTDWNLIIRYDLDAFQSSSFRDLGVHAPLNFEKALDRLTMVIKGMKHRMFDAVLATEVIDTQGKGIKIWAVGANYFAGDFLVLGDDLYRCLADHVAGATFAGDAAHWDLLLDDTMDAKDDAQSIALELVMDVKDAEQTVILESTMDTKDVAQSVVLEASMETKDNIVRSEFAAADTLIQDAVDAIEVKTDNITVTQPVNLDEMEAAIAGGGPGTISEWITGILYQIDSIIWEGEDFYKCTLQHTSGATFAGDAANWNQMSDKLELAEIKALLGITGDAVGTTDAQTLTNKVISTSEILNSKIITKTDTLANLTTYVATATNGELLYASDTKEYYGVKDASLVPLGGGGGLAEWVTATEYSVDDVIWEGTEIYVCTSLHTSGATFAGDAANWTELSPSLDDTTLVHNGGETTGALTLGTLVEGAITFIRNSVAVSWIGTTAQGWLFGIKTVHGGGIDADNRLVENIPTPTITHHAANKEYVDGKVQPLVDINTDTREPTGFIDDDLDHHGVIEYTLDGTTVFQINTLGVYSSNALGLWHDGTNAVAGNMHLSPKDASNPIVYYIKGVKHSLTVGVSAVGTSTYDGIHIFYLDADELLHEQLGYVSAVITERALVTIMYWNATYSEAVDFGAERHGIDMDGATHKWLHENVGAQYKGGMDIQGLAEGVATFTQYDVGVMDDEDISHTLPVQTTAPYWYKDGAHWRSATADNKLGYVGIGTGVSYNSVVNGLGSLLEVTGNNCVIMFSLGTHNAPNKYVRVIGQHLYTKVADARDAIADEVNNLKLNGLPTPEFIFVNAYIIDTNGALLLDAEDNTHLDLRTSSISGLGVNSTAMVHANTTNRDALNSHPATALSFDPTVEGIMEPSVTDVQVAIDTASKLGGGGDVSLYKSLDADTTSVSKWDVTGKLGAVFTDNLVDPLSGKKDYDYSTNINTGAVVSIDFAVPVRSRAAQSSTHKISFPFIQTGTEGSVQCEIYDVTNATSIKTIDLENATNRYLSSFTMPALCTELRFIIKSITDGVATLNIDQISFSDKFGEYGSETISETITNSGFGSRNVSEQVLLTTEELNESNDLLKASYTDHTRYTFKRAVKFGATVSTNQGSNTRVQLKHYNSSNVLLKNYDQSTDDGGVAVIGVSGVTAQTDDYILFQSSIDGNASTVVTSFSVTATAQSQTVQFEEANSPMTNNFDVNVNDATNALTEFNGADDWCSYVSGTDDKVFALNTDVFTKDNVWPKFKVQFTGSIRDSIVTRGTWPNFNVIVRNNSGVADGADYTLFATRSLTDRIAEFPRLLSYATLLTHSNDEFYTGEKWIDGRKIYARSFELASDVGDGVTLATWDTGLEPIGCGRTTVNNHVILNGSSSTSISHVNYEDDTGLVRTNTAVTIYAGTKITMRYVK